MNSSVHAIYEEIRGTAEQLERTAASTMPTRSGDQQARGAQDNGHNEPEFGIPSTLQPIYGHPTYHLQHMILTNIAQWREFQEIGTEMKVDTCGKPLFPSMNPSFVNLDPTGQYAVGLKMVLQSQNPFQFSNGKWEQKRGRLAQIEWESNEVFSETMSGSKAMADGFGLDKKKIYNERSKPGKVSVKAQKANVHEMMRVVQRHQYIPMVTLYLQTGPTSTWEMVESAVFEGTEFIVVTGYVKQELSEKKVDYNKHVTKKTKRQRNRPSVSTSSGSSSGFTTPSPQMMHFGF